MISKFVDIKRTEFRDMNQIAGFGIVSHEFCTQTRKKMKLLSPGDNQIMVRADGFNGFDIEIRGFDELLCFRFFEPYF